MKRVILLVWMVLFAASYAQNIQPEPLNLGILKNTIEYYIKSGAYDSAMIAKYREIQASIEERMEDGKKYAVVMDVDETTLSNIQFEFDYGFGFNPTIWKEWVAKGEATAIPAALKFFNWAKSKGIDIFFVTGRRMQAEKIEDDPTYKNLIKEGFIGFKKLYLKPAKGKIKTIVYKSSARKEIMDMGYIIIANIGDQWSDLEGGNAEMSFKLPNPMYYVK
ncbi:MAG: HAD family acid phosphatase [Calditrichia bacterium]